MPAIEFYASLLTGHCAALIITHPETDNVIPEIENAEIELVF